MKKSKILSLVAVLVLICIVATVALVACRRDPADDDNGITLNQKSLNVVEGKTGTIIATVKGTEEAITWTSDKPDVVAVQSVKTICTVKGLKVGTATITAKAGEYTATCDVTVTVDDSEKVSITLNGQAVTEASVDVDKTITLVATASKGSAITWDSSNKLVATVENGVVKGVAKGTAVITAQVSVSIKASVTVTVTGEGADLVPMQSGTQEGAVASPGTWYYNVQNWVTVSAAYCQGEDMASLSFENNDAQTNPGAWFYTTQLFYKKADLQVGKVYKLSFDVESTGTGRITLNGNVINIEKGENSYTTWYTETAGASFNVQFGVNGIGMEIKDGTVTFKNIKWVEDSSTEKLNAPSFTYNEGTKVITITDPNPKGSVGRYELHFFDASNVDQGNITVENGKAIDLSMAPNGTFTAKLVAVGANIHYTASDPSTQGISITIANEKTNLKNGEEHNAYVNPGNWYEWHDQGWNGSTVKLNDAYMDTDGAIHFNFEITDGSNQFNQAAHLYYHYTDKVVGNAYTLTLKLYASVACTIDFCDEKVAVNVGNNDISVTFVQPAQTPDWDNKPKGATIRIYFNDSGEFILSDIKVESASQIQLSAPSFTMDSDTKVITITDPNTAGVGGYELGFFQGEKEVKVVTIANGATVDPNVVGEGTYTLKVRAVAVNAGYITSPWSTTTATVTSSNKNVELEWKESQNFSDGWAVWWANWGEGNIEVQERYIDATNTIHLKFTGRFWFTYGVQLFYKSSESHRYTVTVKSSVDGDITVCGKKLTLVAGQSVSITTDAGYTGPNGCAMDIQFGYGEGDGMLANGGTFEISYVIAD